MNKTLSVSILGGSGYVGGELLRLLLDHPRVEVSQVTSQSQAGRFVHHSHPNLRGRTDLKFVHPEAMTPCDFLFLAQPHGFAAGKIEDLTGFAERLVDCSADFRLRDPVQYKKWYGEEHPNASWLSRFVYGLPELNREELREARFASGVGCNATVTTFALMPLARAGLLTRVVVDVKVGSSEGGARPTDGSHHPERSGAVRSFKLTGHRHQAEIRQNLGAEFDLNFSVTSVELVRGALATAHCFLSETLEEKDVWKLYRQTYRDERFVRLVKQKTGIFRYPEPKVLSGTNYCDVGFELDPGTDPQRVVAVAAIDNLMKGAAGSAVQTLNVMMGWDEAEGLGFPGLHPL